MWNPFSTAIADTTVCVRIVFPTADLPMGKVFRLKNLTDERRSWIPDILKRSEICQDPGDDLVQEIDVSGMDPTPMNFHATPPEPLTRPQILARYHWTNAVLNRAMDAHWFHFPDKPQWERQPPPPVREGMAPAEWMPDTRSDSDIIERWSMRKVQEFDAMMAALGFTQLVTR
jgi:hypothetical protein